MRPSLFLSALLIVAMTPAAAKAADISGEVGVVSDYRYRGVSLSNRHVAVQGSLDLEFENGTYGELWGSTIADDGAGNVELDATAGHVFGISETVSIDLSATYYAYPGHGSANALELNAMLEASRGRLTARAGASFAPPQQGTQDDVGRKTANLYLHSEIACQVDETPLSVHAGIGREDGPWDMREKGAKLDWTLGLEAEWKAARLSFDYVGSNASADGIVGALALRF